MITNEQRAELRRLAEAATPGPWAEFCESSDWWIGPVDAEGSPAGDYAVLNSDDLTAENSTYITAANPAAILALLDRIDELEARP